MVSEGNCIVRASRSAQQAPRRSRHPTADYEPSLCCKRQYRKAIALLNEAVSKSRKAKTDVFSALQYKTVSRQEFVKETRNLLENLRSKHQRA